MMNRREALTRLGGFLVMGLFGGSKAIANKSGAGINSSAAPAADKSFSIAHITDVHLTDHLHAQKWYAKCLNHLQSHTAKPQLILNTGDSVMDTCRTDRDRADALWKIWQNSLREDCSLPMYSCLGNHDYWATNFKEGNPSRKDPMFGRKLGLDGLGLEKPYYSFDHGGWHFVMLESIRPNKDRGWTCMLGEEQMAWLENDLKQTPADRPVLVSSHVPILQIIFMRTAEQNDDYSFTASNFHMVAEAQKLIEMFRRHKNVKLCFSGHLHQLDRVQLDNVTYICDGAASGNKWKGDVRGVPPGYSITTLHPDGKFDYEYIDYGWKKA